MPPGLKSRREREPGGGLCLQPTQGGECFRGLGGIEVERAPTTAQLSAVRGAHGGHCGR